MARALALVLLSLAAGHVALAQDEEVTTPPAQLVLPLPDPAACNKETFHHFTKHYRSCAKVFVSRHDPDADCCEGFAMYYGVNASWPSKNCFCIADVWTEFISHRAHHAYPFGTALHVCARMGYIIPFNAEEGEGYCYGVPPDEETLAGAAIRSPGSGTPASVKEYFKKMHKDHLVSFSFATGIVSGVGVLFMLWPLTFESAISVCNLFRKKTV